MQSNLKQRSHQIDEISINSANIYLKGNIYLKKSKRNGIFRNAIICLLWFYKSSPCVSFHIMANNCYANSIFVLQRRASRITCGIIVDFTQATLKRLQIMNLPSILNFQCLLFIKQNFNTLNSNSNVHKYNTGNPLAITNDYYKDSATLNSFRLTSLKLFYSIPLLIRQLPLK